MLTKWKIGQSAETVEEITTAILKARHNKDRVPHPPKIDLTPYSRQYLTGELARNLMRLAAG